MTPGWRRRWLAGAVVGVAAMLPLVGEALRGPRPLSCDLDGVAIEPIYAVEATDADGSAVRFCCLRCAEAWRARSGQPVLNVRLRGEISGRTLAPRDAWFVHSPRITTPATGNRTRVFESREAAENHVREQGGHLLEGEERPFGSHHASSSRDHDHDHDH